MPTPRVTVTVEEHTYAEAVEQAKAVAQQWLQIPPECMATERVETQLLGKGGPHRTDVVVLPDHDYVPLRGQSVWAGTVSYRCTRCDAETIREVD